eukprot:gene25818-31181_t
MSLVLLRIVRSLQPVNILDEFPYYLLASLGLPMPIIIVSAAVDGEGFTIMDIGFRCYYWMRIAIIFLNLVLYAKTKYLVDRLGDRVAKGDLTNDQANNIKLLVSRMRQVLLLFYHSVVAAICLSVAFHTVHSQLYGVAQAITRIGPTWHDYNNSTHDNLPSGIIGATLGTSIGIAYFFLFVYMQPQAWEIIREKYLVKYVPCCLPSAWRSSSGRDHGSARLTNWNLAEADDEEIMSRISSSAISVTSVKKSLPGMSTIRETESTEEGMVELQ